MFDSIQQDNGTGSVSCLSSWTASLIVHAAIAGTVILIPMFFVKSMPPITPLAIFRGLPDIQIEMPDVPNPTIAAAMPSSGEQRVSSPSITTDIAAVDITLPVKIPTHIPPPTDETFGRTGIVSGPITFGDTQGGDPLNIDIGKYIVGKPPALKQPMPPEEKIPIRVGILEPSQLIFGDPPEYPEIAKKIRVSGDVLLEAVIDEQGNVTDVSVRSGHRLLQDAAVKAVKTWKCTPTVRNGEPVPILAKIKISFRLQ